MIEEKKQSHQLTLQKLCEAYNFLLASGQVTFPLYDMQHGNLASIVKTVESDYFGVKRFVTDKEQLAAYFYLIIKDHPVTDGNKRLAVLWLETLSSEREVIIELPEAITLDILAVSVEKTHLPIDSVVEMLVKILFKK